MEKTVKVVVFPGTNCDQDIVYIYREKFGCRVERVWHRERSLGDCDLAVIPGGFSYGDYLRCGALAKLSPIIKAIKEYARKGGKVLGICNGFQILCEAGLLPGCLLPNAGGKFISKDVFIKVENTNTPFTSKFVKGEVFKVPIAHFEGNYFIDNSSLLELEQSVVFRYCSPTGEVFSGHNFHNPNGSAEAIAGVCKGSILGMMPHPERPLSGLKWHQASLRLLSAPLN